MYGTLLLLLSAHYGEAGDPNVSSSREPRRRLRKAWDVVVVALCEISFSGSFTGASVGRNS